MVSYYTSRRSRDLVIAARQEITRARWKRILVEFDCHVSILVVQEAEGGLLANVEFRAYSQRTDGTVHQADYQCKTNDTAGAKIL